MHSEEILPGTGLGELKFGMSRDEVKALLGEPDETDFFEEPEEEEDASESWHYDELEISVSFDECDDWKLSTVAVSSARYTLFGKAVVGLSKVELVSMLAENGISDLEEEDWSEGEPEDLKLLTSEELQVNFWMEDGLVSEVQWGILFE